MSEDGLSSINKDEIILLTLINALYNVLSSQLSLNELIEI